MKLPIVFTLLAFFLLTSCQRAITSPTKEPTAIPPTITLTPTITTSPTSTPRFLPKNVGFAMEESVAHVEPTLADMEIVPNTGKSGREGVLGAGITEETISLYENAGYAWALASGFDESSPVTVEEITNRLLGNDFHWQMVFRSLDRGNILWAQSQDGKTYNTFPTMIKVDATGVHEDPAWKAVELPDTKDVAVIFMNGVYPVAVRIPVTGADRNEYYSEWFDTLTGEWVKDSAVEAIPKALYYRGLAGSLDDFTLVSEEGKQAIIQDVVDHPTLPEPQPERGVEIVPFSYNPWSGIILGCKMGSTCAWRASVHTIDPVTGLDQWDVILETHFPEDKNSHVVDLCIDEEADWYTLKMDTTYKLADLFQNSRISRWINFFIPTKRINPINYHNPVVREMVEGVDFQQERDKLQKTLKITDPMSKQPLWVWRIARGD